jgi:hypothetical protein
MVLFKDNAIIISIETATPLDDWQDLLLTIADVYTLLTTNQDFPVSEYRLNMFNELHKAACALNVDDRNTQDVLTHFIESKKQNVQ